MYFYSYLQKTLSRKKKIIATPNEWSRSYPSSVTSDAPTISSQMTDDVITNNYYIIFEHINYLVFIIIKIFI